MAAFLLLASLGSQVALAGRQHTLPTLRARVQPLRSRASISALSVNEKGGFGAAPKPKNRDKPANDDAVGVSLSSYAEPATRVAGQRNADSALERAGLKRSRAEIQVPSTIGQPLPEPGFLSSVPMETQNQIEQVLVAVAGLALAFFITCGFAIIGDAYVIVKKETGVPNAVIAVLQFLSPKFTPALGIVLLCSITLGLFKQAQFSDDGTGIGYRED
ncbi:hypothetical protein T492DRAFT_1031645 [Pavlovales sp. CCMP2436]|nr:hypothetical protein T492DRAFT_1031645 [Pavlovales sp. CCMP2436]